MYHQAKQMLKKARQQKHGRHPTILSRWQQGGKNTTKYSLYDRIAVEKHIYTATRAERIQNSKHWILTINADGGTQQPLNQRPDFAQAKIECKRLHDEHLARTQEKYRPIPRSQQVRQRKGHQFEGNEAYDYAVDPKQVGGSTKGRGETCRQIRQDHKPTCKQLRHRRQSGTKFIGRRAIGIFSILHGLIPRNVIKKEKQTVAVPNMDLLNEK